MKTKTSHSNRGGLRSVGTLLIGLAGVALLCASAGAVDRHVLRGHVPPAVAKLNLQPIGPLPATNRLRLAIGLPLRNTNDLARLLQEIYDPASPQFRHYLTLDRFTERFGPTAQDYEAVKQFTLRHGLEVTATYPNRLVLDVAGPASRVQNAFNVKLQLYAHPTERRTFYAPDVEPSVDAGLSVLDISGLDNYALPRPAPHRAAASAAPHLTGGSGPAGDFMGKDYRNAYAPGVTQTGTGQLVGLVEFEGYANSDVTIYEDLTGLPHVPVQEILLDGFDGSTSGAAGEATLDIDMAVAMAPGLAGVIVFDAGGNGHWADVANSMVTNHNIKQFSSSWILSAFGRTGDQILQEMAAQGQSFFQASGDGECWNNDPVMWVQINNYLWPCDSPYVTSVGGTALTMSGHGTAYASERVWNDGYVFPWGDGAGAGSGGGISKTYSIPAWQTNIDMSANHGSTTMRNFPDVAMNAEVDNVYVFSGSTQTGWGGTSFAAPLWAGFTALINQEAAANGQPPVGFLNPSLYALGQSSNYTNCFHDITVGNNDASPVGPVQFPAVRGYDLCTGWGTPTGSNLINALALPEPLVITPESGLSFTGSVGGTVSPAALSLTLSNRSGSLTFAASQNLLWLALFPASGALLAGGTTNVTITPNGFASSLSAGNYAASLSFTNLSDLAVQLFKVSLVIAGPPLITEQPISVTVPEGATATFSVETATNALLTYQWQVGGGNSATNLVNGGNISGSTTSVLIISNVSPTDAGTYSVIVSNLAGTATSTGASLTVLTGQAPIILSQPTSATLLPGATVSFTVLADGDSPLAYFWQFNGTNLANGGNISGAQSGTLDVASTTAANAGSYTVVITNSFGAVTSAAAVLNITGVTASGVALQVLYSFTTNATGANVNGVFPFAGLLQAKDGNLYGTARGGGADGWGTVFRCTVNGVVSLVHAFAFGSDGGIPYSALIQAADDYLYGTANDNGWPDGTVFKVSTSGIFTGYTLNYATVASGPYAAPIQGRDGNFYGTAAYGGSNVYGTVWSGDPGYGAVYEMTPAGSLTALGTFNFDDGAYPQSSLIQGADGNFYGTATGGGTNGGFGTIFKITPAGTMTALFSFGKTNGADPTAGLIQDIDGSFYGTTYSGGASNAGSVFKLAPDGTFSSLYSFAGGDDGSNCYGGLLLASDGNFYGTTEGGGTYGLGTIFRISREGALTTLVNFDGYQGAVPECTLMQATDGNFYGTTEFGGADDFGAIFRLSIQGALQISEQPQGQTAYAGDSVSFSVATFGSLPVTYQWLKEGTNLMDGGNISGSNARILRLTDLSPADAATYSVVVSNSYGQVSSMGAVLQVNESAPLIVSQPQSQTVLARVTATLSVQATGSGPLYFQWQENGASLADGGDLSGSATPTLTLASVALSNAGPYSVVVSNSVGSVTSTLAVLTVQPPAAASSRLIDLYSFTSTSSGPINPYAGVIQGTDGNFYGTTRNGGAEGFGSVFQLTPFGGFAVLYSFTNGVDGAAPFAGLVQASDGNFYGASFLGAGSPFGALFKLTSTGVFSPLYSFEGGADGGNPIGSLVQGNDGNLYGTASTGGRNGFGAVFRLTTNGVFTPLWSFQSFDGSYPSAPLLPAGQGNFYGTTAFGGSNNMGTVFRLNANGGVTSLASFDYVQGAYPSNGLVQAADGNFYGTASGGGTNGGWGTVFRLTAAGSLTAIHSFNYQDGAVPAGGLVQGLDGNLYGTTSLGGAGGQGTVFEISTNGLLTTLFWFSGADGAYPQSTLIQASDGLFYGTAEFGGNEYDDASQTGDGLVFRLTFDSLVITPSAGFTATGPIGGPFSPATQTFVLTNTSASPLTWSAISPAGNWLAAAPTNGVLAAYTAASVAVGLSAAAQNLGAGVFTTNVIFTNWTTHVAQSEWFGLQIGPSIVQNGGFETGDFTDWTLVGDTVVGGSIYDAVLANSSGYDVAHSGTYGAFLGDVTLATLSQTLPTASGQNYLLSSWLDNPVSGSGQQFLVKWNGAILYNVVDPPAFAWKNLQLIVTASGTSTVLQFGAENGPNYFGLDDISVTPIPTVAFRSAIQGSNGFSLAWTTASGLTYQVQYTTNLSQPQWVNLGAPIVAAGYPLTISDTNGVQSSSQRFYRLVVSP
jgi:uncharacterized repeat protein (TIGR03803 family)